MIRLILCMCLVQVFVTSKATTILVKNKVELNEAIASVKPGDTIELQNGMWQNTTIALKCSGTKDRPITLKAQTAGKVFISGQSKLQLGGNFIIVDGLYFTNGFSGNDAVIIFCIDKQTIANNCRVTNTVVDDFNNPKRLDENYWVALYGKNNRLDHCSFINKKNIGVLLAVILDDERSRENFHSIDHNYFGKRLPLASNGGEIIRAGVSQHCEFNSNTLIIDNYFEQCDGEGEIISIKSGNNIIRNNLFKECQGAVVLRHGNYNTVENNIFLGNNKVGTGGIRIINKGQWVVNNYHYQCIGEGFRSPLTIMNGVPNSPANRYVAVSDAVIANNTYIECSPISLCEGSDTERSVPPVNVQFLNNIFYSGKSMQLANVYDAINGITFLGNLVNKQMILNLPTGFSAVSFNQGKPDILPIPKIENQTYITIGDSIYKESLPRLSNPLSEQPGFSNGKILAAIQENANKDCGAKWYKVKNNLVAANRVIKDCKNAEEVIALMSANTNSKLIINLTGAEYNFNAPIQITTSTLFTTSEKNIIKFALKPNHSDFLFIAKAGNSLEFENLQLDLKDLVVRSFVSSDTSGNSNHGNFSMQDCSIIHLNGALYTAAKSSVSDSIVIRNNKYSNGEGVLLDFSAEADKRGYYNVEKLIIDNNSFNNHSGQLLSMLRSGNDESTMGPNLIFRNNNIAECNSNNGEAIIYNYGTQLSVMANNKFVNCNPDKILIQYEDAVKANHEFRNNVITSSGKVIANKYVVEGQNVIK